MRGPELNGTAPRTPRFFHAAVLGAALLAPIGDPSGFRTASGSFTYQLESESLNPLLHITEVT